MKKLKILLKLSYKFTKKYTPQYTALLAKPLLAVVIGILFLFLGQNFPLIMLFSIPCLCYAFWKGFFITYALNYAAFDFIKLNKNLKLSDLFEILKPKEANFALYITFCAFLSLIFYIPTFIHIFRAVIQSDILSNPYSAIDIINNASKVAFINTLFLFPFLNFMTQAYFFKKDDENFFKLIFNCYKKLDLTGLMICFIIGFFGFFLNSTGIIIIAFFVFNPFCYGINTFWYCARK